MITKILKNERIADGIYDMTIEMPEAAVTAVPGQFLHVLCGKENMLRRPISICAAEGRTLRMVYATKGVGTRWLKARLAGEMLDVLGPLGHGFDVTENKKTLLVGGGIGVPPMLFASSRLPDTHAVLGFRNKQIVCLTGEFKSAEIVTDDGSFGAKAYPHEIVRERIASGGFEQVFACGPLAMLRAVAKECENVVTCYVSMEERMGCGVGACLVCACATKGSGGLVYKHACKDGPVFNAAEVDWNA